jgi:hypothetical protein
VDGKRWYNINNDLEEAGGRAPSPSFLAGRAEQRRAQALAALLALRAVRGESAPHPGSLNVRSLSLIDDMTTLRGSRRPGTGTERLLVSTFESSVGTRP